jgi:phosphonate transport system permease protein
VANAIPELPERQAAALAATYDRAVAVRRRRGFAVLAALVVLIGIAADLAEVRPIAFVTHLDNLGNYIRAIVPSLQLSRLIADVRAWYWNFGGWSRLLFETILMAYLGTSMGAVAAFGLCFFASANLVKSRLVRFAARRFLEFCRTVPDFVFALIFIIAFGLGPMAGVLALAVHTTGALGKLFAEVVENIEMRPVEGVTATGASWTEAICFAVLPQVLSGFASNALLRFEINVRAAGVMGFVGAGGIGQEFLVAIRNFYYSDVSAILVMMIATVVAIDLATEALRHRLIGLGDGR